MELLTVADVARTLGLTETRARQLLRDGQLVAVSACDGPRRVPAPFLQDGTVVKGLPPVAGWFARAAVSATAS